MRELTIAFMWNGIDFCALRGNISGSPRMRLGMSSNARFLRRLAEEFWVLGGGNFDSVRNGIDI